VLKRLVVSLVALSVLLTCYMVYVRLFGYIPHLTPLEVGLLPPGAGSKSAWETSETGQSNRARDIARQVFGPDSWQAQDDVVALYWLHNGVIIFIKDYERQSPQAWRLVPFSLVYQDQPKTPGDPPQIVTMEGKEAVLEFDRPVDLIHMTGAKPIGGKITGAVQIQCDRGTPDPIDDIVAYMDSLEFLDAEKKIWTASPVRLVSSETVMTGTGGEIHLYLDDSQKKSRDVPLFQGVRDFVLFRDVRINMLAGGDHAMPGAARGSRQEAARKQKPKTPVTITCNGPFVYTIEEALGQFSDTVMMIRQTGDSQYDRLFCDTLDILFEKLKAGEVPEADRSPGGMQLQYRRAHATGQTVRVVSDGQSVEAVGAELEHDALTGQTILRGDPDVLATRGGDVLRGRELRFESTEKGQPGAEVVGAGSLESRIAETGDIKMSAQWTEWARLEQHGDQGPQQVLTLQGAVEVDQPGRGTVNANRVKVWLTPSKLENPVRTGQAATDGSKLQPSRIEGIGNVVARSPQFILEAPGRIDMTFEDVPPTGASPPGNNSPLARPGSEGPGKNGRGRSAAATLPSSLAGTEPGANASADFVTKIPAHVRAEQIRIRALRVGSRTEIAEAWSEGNVNLDQPPDGKETDAVVVRGDSLYLKRVEGKSHLEVTGRPAHVELNDLKVDGANVGIDQPTGVAWVEGKGSMVILSETSFDGKKQESPTEMTITWGANMFFNGEVAEFGGGVDAQQGTSQLGCQRLEAFLTERMDISAPRQKVKNAAQIKKLICTDTVSLDNTEMQGDRLIKHDHLEAQKLEFTNLTGKIFASGPGIVRSYTRGQSAMMPAPGNAAANAKAKKDDDQLFLTEIHYSDRMEGERNQQIGKFFGHVEVIRCPVIDQHQKIDPDKPSPNLMRLACEYLEMASKRGPDDRPYNEMIGTGNVDVDSNGMFSGRSDRISYNQLHDRIILESRPGTYSTLYRQPQRGARWDEFRAFKIFYNLRTTDVKVEGAVMFDLQEREADQRNLQRAPTKK